MPSSRYILIVLAVAALPFLVPALVGGGFILAGVLAGLILLALIGVPLGWELKLSREMGAKGARQDARRKIEMTEDEFRRLLSGSDRPDEEDR